MKNWLRLGDWNAICDVCGFKHKASTMLKRWDGLMVCKQDFEVRHPQDYIKGVVDDPSVPWTRPDADLFVVSPYVCNVFNSQAITGVTVAGCMIAGRYYANLT